MMMKNISILLILTALAIVCLFVVRKLEQRPKSVTGKKANTESVINSSGGGTSESDQADGSRPKKRVNQAGPGKKRIKTESGLEYVVLEEGSGERPGPTDTVRVNYEGWLENGKEFDRSREGVPVEFPLNRLIKGWTEGLQLMQPGAKFRFTIPPELAYGASGAGGKIKIPPNATLIYEVELIEVKK